MEYYCAPYDRVPVCVAEWGGIHTCSTLVYKMSLLEVRKTAPYIRTYVHVCHYHNSVSIGKMSTYVYLYIHTCIRMYIHTYIVE